MEIRKRPEWGESLRARAAGSGRLVCILVLPGLDKGGLQAGHHDSQQLRPGD